MIPSSNSVPLSKAVAAGHSKVEDLIALLVGTILISFGVELYRDAGLLSGGVAGVAFLLHYATGTALGPVFFALNLPFYWLALRRMGYSLTFKTFVAVTLFSAMTEAIHELIAIKNINIGYASVLGGVVLGMGFLVLFRHRASLGGIGVFVLYLQDKFELRAGAIQLAIDGVIVIAAFFVVDPARVAWSVLGVVVLNMLLALNHGTGRYTA